MTKVKRKINWVSELVSLAVVLAAGLGTRMKSRLPKVLHPLCGRRMIDYVLDTEVDDMALPRPRLRFTLLPTHAMKARFYTVEADHGAETRRPTRRGPAGRI